MLFSSPSSKGHITTPATKISDCIADANFVEASYDCLPPEYDMRDLDTLALCSDSDSENDDSSSGHGLSASRDLNGHKIFTRKCDAAVLLTIALLPPFLRLAFLEWRKRCFSSVSTLIVSCANRNAASVLCRVIETRVSIRLLQSLSRWVLVTFVAPQSMPLKQAKLLDVDQPSFVVEACPSPSNHSRDVSGVAGGVSLARKTEAGEQECNDAKINAKISNVSAVAQLMVTDAQDFDMWSAKLLRNNSNRSTLPPPPPPKAVGKTSKLLNISKNHHYTDQKVPQVRPTRSSHLRQQVAPSRFLSAEKERAVMTCKANSSSESVCNYNCSTALTFDIATVRMPRKSKAATTKLPQDGYKTERKPFKVLDPERLRALSSIKTSAQALNGSFKSAIGQIPNVLMHDLHDGSRQHLWDLFSHTLLVLDFYIAKGTARETFPLVSVDA